MNNSRTLPLSELDLQLMLTEPEWGKEGIPDDLKIELTENAKGLRQLKSELEERVKNKLLDIKEAQKILDAHSTKGLWGLLAYYTKDMRLANLSVVTGEVAYCQKWLDFAGDCLRAGYVKSFTTALSRVITILELSQSKGGFLRKRHGTFTQEHKNEQIEPQKKGLFGDKKLRD